MGHEISGVVDVIGPGVSELSVGDHVAIQPILPDNTCYACRLNRSNCCAQQGFYGLSKTPSLFALLAPHLHVKSGLRPEQVSMEV